MLRKLFIAGLLIVGLHTAEILTLGTTPTGSLFANSLQILTSGIASAMCIFAFRRGRGMSRPFWLLAACGTGVWGVANIGWMYYETVLHAEPPIGSAVRFLFDTQDVFFAMALYLDQDKDSPTLDPESLLDLVQIAIVFFFIFLGLYYIPSLHLDRASAIFRETWVQTGENAVLIALTGVQTVRARTPGIRKLYGGLLVYLLIYSFGAFIANYAQVTKEIPTGTWYDLAWTLPLLWGAVWAARWQPIAEEKPAVRARERTLGELLFSNAMFAVVPLIVVVQVSQFGAEWRLLCFSLLGVSILCFAARMGISEYRKVQGAAAIRRHMLAMDSAIDGIAILNVKRHYAYVNSAYAHIFGYTAPEQLVGNYWRNLHGVENAEQLAKEIPPAIATQGKWLGEAVGKRRDGSRFPMELAMTGMPGGEMIAVVRDITERHSAERARTEAEIKYRTLVEQVAAVSYIAELGVKGEWLYVSPQVEDMFGFSPEEWLAGSTDWIRHIPPEDHAAVEAAEEASQRGERFQAEYRVIHKDGRMIWVSDTAVVVPGSDSHPVMEGIIVDITERKALENQLQQSRRMEAVGRLAGGVAHDFNNLLTIIKGYAEMALNRSGNSPEVTADVRHIGDASERAAALVRQLLAFSRKQVLQPKSLDLNSIVLGLDKLLQRLVGEDIVMKTMADENVGTVKADPGQIEQVIMNLVVNARDAMPHGGRLTLETTNADLDDAYARDHVSVRPGRYVMLAVTDTGVGMTPETIAHIFEPFYTTKESGHGTGLGLSTVYGIVKQSGGYIWVYSEPGKGTAFKIYLPRVDEPAEALTFETRELPRRGTETILLVEDNEGVRELARMILDAQGYDVLVAENPDDAVELCQKHSGGIHLLLTDVVMPGVSGLELTRRITARYPSIRVLYMSGYTYDVIAQGGVLEPGVAFLQKPFTPRDLAAKIREVLDSALSEK
jgi:PAS domain S-box-containing protein